MKYLHNRTTLSFGLPLAITAILLLVLNVFWFKKNADGDYIDNGLVYETTSSETKHFQIMYEGAQVIELRDGIKKAIKAGDKFIANDFAGADEDLRNVIDNIMGTNFFTSKNTLSEETQSQLQEVYLTWILDEDLMAQSLKRINNKIDSHNNSNDFFRLLYSAILILFPIYVLPISISFFRLHSYRWPISIITVFTAWTGIGFIVMLTWSVWPKGKFS